MRDYYDISVPLSEGIAVWPGTQKFKLSAICRMARGDSNNESAYSGNIHCGTHVDYPWHFIEDGNRSGDLDISRLIGTAFVADLPGVKAIDTGVLESLALPDKTTRLLFKTDNSAEWATGKGDFNEDFVSLTLDAAKWIVDKNMSVVGIDYLSIQRFGDSDETHRVLLSSDVLVIEGLNLSNVPSGVYQLVCLPLSIADVEGAPARAILIKEEKHQQ